MMQKKKQLKLFFFHLWLVYVVKMMIECVGLCKPSLHGVLLETIKHVTNALYSKIGV